MGFRINKEIIVTISYFESIYFYGPRDYEKVITSKNRNVNLNFGNWVSHIGIEVRCIFRLANMTTNIASRAKILRYSLLISLLVLIILILEQTTEYVGLHTMHFFFMLFYLILAVLWNRRDPRPYLIPIKTIALATLFILIGSFIILLILSMMDEYPSRFFGTQLPHYVSKIIIFLVSSLIPFIVATILGLVVNSKVAATETLDDHLTK